MSSQPVSNAPTIDHKPHAVFFRQSGWLIITAVAGGAMSYLVHFLNKYISAGEYTAFGVLLTAVSCLPMSPVQMVFTQQSALALASGRERQLSNLIRMVWLCTTILWGLLVLAVFHFQNQIVQGWHLPNALSLWVAVAAVLLYMWLPVFSGVLQGRQDFFYVGWSTMFGGIGRLLVAAILVLALGWGAAGMMAGVLCGFIVGVLIAVWRTRDLWSLPPEKFQIAGLVRQVTPLLFGFGACQVLFTSDTLYAKGHFSDDAMKPYVMAGTLSRALLWLVMPLASVMFPKLIQSRVKSEKNNLFGLVVLGTAILSVCGALGLWITGPLVVRILGHASDVAGTMALIPWYAGAMVPLALANVMANDLLARERYAVVPFMVVLAVVYCLTLPKILDHFPGHIEVVLQTLAVFNLLLFGVCALFAWVIKPKHHKPRN